MRLGEVGDFLLVISWTKEREVLDVALDTNQCLRPNQIPLAFYHISAILKPT